MEKHVRTIRAQRASGGTLTIEEFQSYIDTTSINDTGPQWTPHLKRLQLPSGGAVNFIDDVTFEIVSTGERVTKL